VDDVRATMIEPARRAFSLTGPQEELERLEKQHRVLTDLVFRDLPRPLFLAPVREPIRVLDCGHGSGAWVVEVAESYPDCEVMFFSSNVAGKC
jgi:hypothetical protein